MGFAEIQAAFASQGQAPAPQPATQAPAVAQASAFTPSPFGAMPAAAPAFTPTVQPPAPAPMQPPAQQAFTFTPPAGFNPTSAPPINPPGERAALAAPAAAPVQPEPTMHEKVPPLPGIDGVPAPVAAPPAEPKRRGRKPGAKNAGGMPGVVAEAPARGPATQAELAAICAQESGVSLAADGAAIATMPPDGSSVEDIVSELFARGVSSVHLTFTKDGK